MRFLSHLAIASLALAQSIPPDEIHSRTVPYVPPSKVTIRTDVRIVEVPVVVRDARFHTVAGLTREDFEIDDNGKKQPITAFSVQNFKSDNHDGVAEKNLPGPRFLALCFDDLHLLPAFLKPVKDAAVRFVTTSLARNDQVVIVRTSHSGKSSFTADVSSLVAQIDGITSDLRSVTNDVGMCPRFDPYEAFQIAERKDPGDRVLHTKMRECAACSHSDHPCPEGLVTGAARSVWEHERTGTGNALGVIENLVDSMAKLPGQRVVLLTSGGFLTGTFETDVDRLMEKARRAEVLINSLDARGLGPAGTAYDGMGVLALGTGGTFFHNNNNMEEGFRELGMVPETTYMLSFASPGPSDGSFHKLKVSLADAKGYSIEARLGYTAQPDAPASNLDTEVLASDTISDLPASFSWEQWPGPSGITMIAHLDIGHLHFKPNQDRRAQKLTFVAVLLDNQGAFVTGKRSELQLNLKDATFTRLAKTGFTAALTLQAPPGTYSVRALAQDAVENKLASASGEVKIK